MSNSDSNHTSLDAAVHALIVECLAPYGSSAAVVAREVNQRETNGEITTFTVTPINKDAATVRLDVGSKQGIQLVFGHTSVLIKGPDEHVLDRIRVTLPAIFAGDFVETGPGRGQAEVTLGDKTRLRLGALKSPIARRFGPKARYESYSS